MNFVDNDSMFFMSSILFLVIIKLKVLDSIRSSHYAIEV